MPLRTRYQSPYPVRNSHSRWRCFDQILILAIALATGCTGQSSTKTDTGTSPGAASDPATPSPAGSTSSPIDPNRKETRWIGNIPYDVFFDDPLMIAADTTRVGTTTNSPSTPISTPGPSTPAPTTEPESGSPAPPPATAAQPAIASRTEPDWKAVLPMPVLVDEVKILRTRLTANLQTVATYNKSIPAVSNDGTLISALGAIAAVHPEEVNWKPKAPFVRDLGYTIYSSAEGTGRTPFNACKEPFDKITAILDGGPPPEGDAAMDVPFADIIYVSELMKRVEVSVNGLKSNFNTEARMKEDPATAKRELHVLAAIAAMISTDSYDNSQDEKYQTFLRDFRESCLQGVEAVQTENFAAYQDSINKIQNSCNPCHLQFRGKESGL